LTEEVIEAYIRSKEPFDKAGGYAIQGIGGLFVEKIEGDFYNVMGFPIGRVFETFLEKGWLNGTEFLHSSERATVEIWREEFEQ
jgi:septum formation protein